MEAITKAIEKVRSIESSKEQRYLLRTAATELLAVAQPAGPPPQARNEAAPSVSPKATVPDQAAHRAESPQQSVARAAPSNDASAPSAAFDDATLPMSCAAATATATGISTSVDKALNCVATTVRGYLVHCTAHNRTNTRILEAALELAQCLLSSGLIPVDATWPPTSLVVPSHVTASVFSKMFGRVQQDATPPATPQQQQASPNLTGDGAAVATAGPGSTATPPAAALNVFEALAMASLSVAQLIPPLESTASFAAAAAVLAAIIPESIREVSPPRVAQLQEDGRSTASMLGLRGAALHCHVYALMTMTMRASPSMPALAAFLKTALGRVVSIMSTEVELLHTRHPMKVVGGHIRRTASMDAMADTSHAAATASSSSPSKASTPTPRPREGIEQVHEDVATVLNLCVYLLEPNHQPTQAEVAKRIARCQAVVSIVPNRTPETRALCLTTVLQFVVNGGPGFRKSAIVLQCAKHALFPTVLQNALSTEVDVYRLSLNLFLALYNTFQAELVVECGAFFQHVIFQILASKNATAQQKILALEVVQQIAEEPKNLLNMYLNYDCDAKSTNVYETLLHHLDGFANGKKRRRPPANAASAQSESPALGVTTPHLWPNTAANDCHADLQRLALATLLCISEAHLQWIERFEDVGGDMKTQQQNESLAHGGSGDGGGGEHEGGGAARAEGDDLRGSVTYSGTGGVDPSMLSSMSTSGACATSDLTQVLLAKRRKGQHEEFIRLFNIAKQPEKALRYLVDSAAELLPESTNLAHLGIDRRLSSMALRGLGSSTSSSPPPRGSSAARDSSDDDEAHAKSVGPAVQSLEAMDQAQRIASFLFAQDGLLDRCVLGDFFAKCYRKEAHQQIFNAWVEHHDFRGMSIDQALRRFLGGFKLLGESQVVDRTMEIFAGHYCRLNPTAFTSANTAFVLSFSICMLNTDAHSAHVADKMTKEGFVRNNRGVDDGKDLDGELLSGIYDRIVKQEIKLRPLKPGAHTTDAHGGGQSIINGVPMATAKRQVGSTAVAVLESIPLLRRLVPLAESIGDAVMIPVDAAGNILFNTAQRKRSQNYSAEFHGVFRDAMSLLREHKAEGAQTAFLEADSLEHALPMWDLTVDIIVDALEVALHDTTTSATGTSAFSFAQPKNEDVAVVSPVQADASQNAATPSQSPGVSPAVAMDAAATGRMEALFQGVQRTFRVCAALGSMAQAQRLMQRLYHLSLLPSLIALRPSTNPDRIGCDVTVKQRIPLPSLRCAVAVMEALAADGSAFPAEMWSMGYHVVSYIDALLVFVREGHRRPEDARRTTAAGDANAPSPTEEPKRRWAFFGSTPTEGPVTPSTASANTGLAAGGGAAAPLPSVSLNASLGSDPTPPDIALCQLVIKDLQSLCSFELWVERLYDASSASSQSLLQMVNGLCTVCTRELDVGRVFSLSRLAEFCTVCTTVTTRMQWRDLWLNCEPIFTLAGGSKHTNVALRAIDGLKGIAYHYLLKEELAMYRFQKDLLRPFERILMRNGALEVRTAILKAAHDMVENRVHQLASGWSLVFSLLSHGALIPELVRTSWVTCELLLTTHLPHLSECFSDLVFCLTSFASNAVDGHVALLGASYLLACGSWLQIGLSPLRLEGSTQQPYASPTASMQGEEAQPEGDGVGEATASDNDLLADGEVSPARACGGTIHSASLRAAQHILCASLDALDAPALLDALDAIDDAETLRGLCKHGGVFKAHDLSKLLALSAADWQQCLPDEPSNASVSAIRYAIRLAERMKRNGTEAIPPPAYLYSRATQANCPRTHVDADEAVSLCTLRTTDTDVPNLSQTAAPCFETEATKSPLHVDAAPTRCPYAKATAMAAAPRIATSSTPLSASYKLLRPTNFGIRTEYHLWASLFEGLVPIIIAHANTTVRRHAVRCLWELIRRFGVFFDPSVQQSLLAPLLRSAVSAVAMDEGLLALHSSPTTSNTTQYKVLVEATLRGMVYACGTDPHLVSLACGALRRVAGYARHPMCVQAGLVEVMVALTQDVCAAVADGAATPSCLNADVHSQQNVRWWATTHPRVFQDAHAAETLQSMVLDDLFPAVFGAWDAVASPEQESASIVSWLPSMEAARLIMNSVARMAVVHEGRQDEAVAVQPPPEAPHSQQQNELWHSALAQVLSFLAVKLDGLLEHDHTDAPAAAATDDDASALHQGGAATPRSFPSVEGRLLSQTQSVLSMALGCEALSTYLTATARPMASMPPVLAHAIQRIVTTLMDAVQQTVALLWRSGGPDGAFVRSSMLNFRREIRRAMADHLGDATSRLMTTLLYQTSVASLMALLSTPDAAAAQLFSVDALLRLLPLLPSQSELLLHDGGGSFVQSLEHHVMGLVPPTAPEELPGSSPSPSPPRAAFVVERTTALLRVHLRR